MLDISNTCILSHIFPAVKAEQLFYFSTKKQKTMRAGVIPQRSLSMKSRITSVFVQKKLTFIPLADIIVWKQIEGQKDQPYIMLFIPS